jgi:hypothetical protein
MNKRLQKFVDEHSIERRHGGLVFYKAVTKDYGPWCTAHLSSVPDELAKKHGSGEAARRNCKGAYEVGMVVKCDDYDTDVEESCAAGLHVGTNACARSFHNPTDRIIECLVMPEDIVCVPNTALDIHSWTEGHKVRCKKLQVLKDITDEFLIARGTSTFTF